MRSFAMALAPVFAVGTLTVIAASQARAADEPTIVVVKPFPVEGHEDEAQAWLTKLVTFVPANNPGVTFRLHRSTKSPVVFLLYETYPSQAALDSQPKTVLRASFKEFGATPEGLYTKPNEVELCRMSSDWASV
jgi:quinol monooxygenase YgiN